MPDPLLFASANARSFDYDAPDEGPGATRRAWACVPPIPTSAQREQTCERIRTLLRREDAVLVTHYYVDADLQDLARETGGCVGDSLEMARFGRDHEASTIVVAGVRFMGETACILSPQKRILMPDLAATCSLDLGCEAEAFARFRAQHPGRTVVVYANTSAAVKAQADWVVTSSVGLDIVANLHARGERILWAPDRHLGRYIQHQSGADMVHWGGSCLVHDEFKALALETLRREHPDAAVLAHPEAPAGILSQADVIGSTTRLIEAARQLPARTLIVATDQGILHEMRRQAPGKTLLAAPTAGESASCKSCAACPWMAMNSLAGVAATLEHGTGEIRLDPTLAEAARRPITRMLDFAAARGQRVQSSGDLARDQALFQHVGAA